MFVNSLWKEDYRNSGPVTKKVIRSEQDLNLRGETPLDF